MPGSALCVEDLVEGEGEEELDLEGPGGGREVPPQEPLPLARPFPLLRTVGVSPEWKNRPPYQCTWGPLVDQVSEDDRNKMRHAGMHF